MFFSCLRLISMLFLNETRQAKPQGTKTVTRKRKHDEVGKDKDVQSGGDDVDQHTDDEDDEDESSS